MVGDSFVHLKRKRVITEDGVWITPSDSHLKKLLELTGLNWKSAGCETPQTKDLTAASEGTGLSPEDSTLCRSIIGILMYLASDRQPNISRGIFSKPVSMGSSSPGVGMTLLTWWYGQILTGQGTRKQGSRELQLT